MKMSIIGLGLAAFTVLGAVSSVTAESEANGWNVAGVRIANPLDSSTWWDGAHDLELDNVETVEMNLADPEFWMAIPSVDKHSVLHKGVLNPASWAQFAKPETYAKMMDINIWMKWAKPETYSVLVDPQTYVYRMQPGAFLHVFDAHSYAQLMNPAAYLEIADAALETAGMSYVTKMGKDAIASVME